MIDRRLKKQLRANVLLLPDAALVYLREEVAREQNRRRLQVRERHKANRIKASPLERDEQLILSS